MPEGDRKALKAGIEREGRIHTPLHINTNLEILDGLNRCSIAIDLNFPKVPVVTLHFDTPEEEELHALRANLERRQMNEGQRGLLWAEILKIEQKIAEEKKREANREAAIQQHEKERTQEKEAIEQFFQSGSPHQCGDPLQEKEKNRQDSTNKASKNNNRDCGKR